MIRNRIVAFGLFVVVFLLIWNLLDLLYASFIVGSAYQFKPVTDLAVQLITAFLIGYLLFLRKHEE